MAPQVGGLDRYHDDVPEAAGDVPVAARTEVGLQRLVGLDEADLEFAEHRIQRVGKRAARIQGAPTGVALPVDGGSGLTR